MAGPAQDAMSKAKVHTSAEKRLMRDYKEILAEPVLGVSCEPLEGNLFCWFVPLSSQHLLRPAL
jgi:hypothetical protein